MTSGAAGSLSAAAQQMRIYVNPHGTFFKSAVPRKPVYKQPVIRYQVIVTRAAIRQPATWSPPVGSFRIRPRSWRAAWRRQERRRQLQSRSFSPQIFRLLYTPDNSLIACRKGNEGVSSLV